MGWLKDLLGPKTQESAAEVEVHLQVSETANPYLEEWERTKKGRPANDHVSVLIRGEASYQDNLRMITGRRETERVAVDDLVATLIREPENPHDPLAIRVEVQGMTVGYVSRGNARKYARRMDRALAEGWRPEIPCWIGCHDAAEHENPNIGVRLKIPRDSPLERKLSD